MWENENEGRMGRVILVGAVTGLVALALSTRQIADLQVVVRAYVPHAGFVGHFGLFLLLGLTLGWVARGQEAGWSLVSLGILALGLEAVQEVLPGRSVEIGDMVANGAGALAGFALTWGIGRLRAPP